MLRRDTIAIVAVPGETEVSSPATGIRRYANNVRLHHQGTQFFCDEAIHQLATNRIIAHGHIRVVQGDTVTTSADSLRYDGATQNARFAGNVLFEHNRVELTTSRLDYNLSTGAVRYEGESRFSDGPNILTSLRGQYDTRTGQLKASERVALATAHATQRYDTLQYALNTKPVPSINFSEATQGDSSDIVRQRTLASTGKTNVPTKPAPNAAIPPPLTNPPTQLPGSSTSPRVTSAAKQPSRSGQRRAAIAVTTPTDGESELERLLNKPRQTR